MESSYLTRDQTEDPCIGSAKPLDQQGGAKSKDFCSIFMIYLSADSPGWYVCVCVCVCEREIERERERKRESLCLKRAITGTAGLSSRVSGTEHTLKGTTLLSFKPR